MLYLADRRVIILASNSAKMRGFIINNKLFHIKKGKTLCIR